MNTFPQNFHIQTLSGEEATVIDLLGAGYQGAVYKVRYQERELALKWYFPERMVDPVRFYDNLHNNIKKGAPTKAFLWPIELTPLQGDSFGYLMELCPPAYKEFTKFLLAQERFSGVGAIINAALSIISGFRALHNRGYSYQDLNDGNFFVDPQTGDVRICDNDNVAPYGENLGIGGKCRYVAPEIVTGDKAPDIHTDRFSLALILFMLLFYNHPLEGKRTMCPCLTDELERKFYGTEPVFIYDPLDTSNLPVRGVHDNTIMLWPLYPEFIRELFINAFSQPRLIGGDVEHRIIEKEWQDNFLALRDMTVRCRCGSETFLDMKQKASLCISCGCTVANPPSMQLGKHMIALSPGNKIYKSHLDSNTTDFAEVIGEVVQSKINPEKWGIRNTAGDTWVGTNPSGEQQTVIKGETIPIRRGSRIDISGRQAVIS